jgi:hypothetical protein
LVIRFAFCVGSTCAVVSSSQIRPTRIKSPERTTRGACGESRTGPTNVPLLLPSSMTT